MAIWNIFRAFLKYFLCLTFIFFFFRQHKKTKKKKSKNLTFHDELGNNCWYTKLCIQLSPDLLLFEIHISIITDCCYVEKRILKLCPNAPSLDVTFMQTIFLQKNLTTFQDMVKKNYEVKPDHFPLQYLIPVPCNLRLSFKKSFYVGIRVCQISV